MATRYEDQGDGTFILIRDDGMKSPPFLDPDGSMRRELDSNSTASGEIAGQKSGGFNPLAGNSMAMPANPAAVAPGKTQILTQDSLITPQAKAQLDAQQKSVVSETAAISSQNAAAQQAAATQPAPPQQMMRMRLPGSPGESQTTTTAPQTSYSQSESITDKDPTGEIATQQAEAIDAQRAANEAVVSGKQKGLENSGRLIMNEMLRAEAENRTQTEIANAKEVAMAEALAARKAARNTPIDPGQAFADGAGAAAIAATIGYAIANVGLAWMGQAAKPVNVIDGLIDRSIALQREQRSLAIDESSENVEMNRAAMAEAKANARVALAQQLNSQRAYVENENQLAALDGLIADNEAKLQQQEVEYATAIADDVVKQKSVTQTSGGSSTTTKAGTPDMEIEIPVGSDEETAADAVNAARFDAGATEGDKKQLNDLKDNVTSISDRARIIDELEKLEAEGGYVSDVIGVWQGGRGALAAITPGVSKANLQNPKQQRAQQLMEKLEIHNAQDSKRESNSVKRQEMQARNEIPQNDRDLPDFFARQKEGVKARKADQYLGYDDKVVGKFRTQSRRTKPSGNIESF